MIAKEQVRTFPLVLLLILFGSDGAKAFDYFDNVKEALVSGRRFLDQRKYRQAQTDFENVLLMDPGNETAHLELFRVYVAQKKPLLARRVVERLEKIGVVEPSRLASMRKELDSLGKGADPLAKDGVNLDARMLEFLAAANVDASRNVVDFTSLDTASGKTFGSEPPPVARPKSESMDSILGGDGGDLGDLDDLDDDLDDAGPGRKKPVVATATKNPASALGDGGAEPSMDPLSPDDAKTPDGRFARSIALAKKKEFDAAIPLYVTAIQAKPSLMGMDDFGLLQLSRQAYLERVKKEPKNANLHFLVAFFHERFSEYDKAIASYERARDLSPKGSKLALHARDKVVALEQRKVILARQVEEDARKQAQKKAEAEVDLVAMGKATDVTTGAEYHKKGTEHYQKWLGARDKQALRWARAYFEGALVKEPQNPEFHFRYAVLLIDEASLGDATAKAKAKAELEKTLSLNPPDAFRKEAETLLKSLAVGS